MDKQKKAPESEQGEQSDRNSTDGIEDFYGGLQKVPLKVLDIFIGLCIAALVIVIAVGVMNR